ncbi:hypothetical protein ACQSSU_12945 [Micromonospora echinospora]
MQIPEQVAALWGRDPWLAITLAVGVALLAVAALTATIWLIAKVVRFVRTAAPNLKLLFGQALVQAGVTWAVVTGTYEFCVNVFKLPDWEASAFAVFLEAATWVTVGMIYDHGKGVDKEGKPNTGFGPAGPFFFLFSVLGGVLAVIAGATFGAQIGRAVIVVFGTCLWYLALLRVTRRSGTPTRFRWTPRAFLIAVGAMSPAEQDVRDEHQEWQVRRMARAMRWANGRWPWSWLGTRMLTGRAEQASEDVIAAARRRYAVAHVVVSSVRPDSEVMSRLIAEVKRGPAEPIDESTRDQLDEIRLITRQATTGLRHEYRAAFGSDQVDQVREVRGIRMPAHIADQIPDQIPAGWVERHLVRPTRPVDQNPGPDRTSRVDQAVDQPGGPDRPAELDQPVDQTEPRDLVHTRTSPAPVDQIPTSASVPAARTTPVQRTTVRVDRARPVSPAAGGEIPPRVQTMVRDLRRKYRTGPIPGRRTVMPAMGWTNHEDAQTAINLVRAERTKTDQTEED